MLLDIKTIKQLTSQQDTLTKLDSRSDFFKNFETATWNAKKRKTPMVLFFVDMDKFKQINDKYGHSTGDEILRTFSGRLRRAVRKSDLLCRFGGDEFVGLFTHINSVEDAKHALDNIIRKIKRPLTLNKQQVDIGCSIGCAVYEKDGKNLNTLIRKADHAMYTVKERGGMAYKFYDKKDDKKQKV
jgi:diguanylate cyclase (GGDEF)-like protein